MLAVKDYTLTFSDPQATELVVSGGKGVNLARLTLGACQFLRDLSLPARHISFLSSR